MTAADSFVATLATPADAVLSAGQIDAFAASIVKSGGTVQQKTRLAGGHAADIFFTGGSITTTDLPFDVIIQPAAGRRKKILIADMESTIIPQEMLDILADEIGVGGKVADITYRTMNGELDFAASLIERVKLLKGQPEELLYKMAARMTLTPGAEALVAAMKAAGAHCWLVSGGFDIFVKAIADQVGFDRFFANRLLVSEGVLTGEVNLPILDKNSKKLLLEKACAEYGCKLSETLTVGDGANDVPMLEACAEGGGLGVAFHAKPAVRKVIHNQINHGDLSALIYVQGLIPG